MGRSSSRVVENVGVRAAGPSFRSMLRFIHLFHHGGGLRHRVRSIRGGVHSGRGHILLLSGLDSCVGPKVDIRTVRNVVTDVGNSCRSHISSCVVGGTRLSGRHHSVSGGLGTVNRVGGNRTGWFLFCSVEITQRPSLLVSSCLYVAIVVLVQRPVRVGGDLLLCTTERGILWLRYCWLR